MPAVESLSQLIGINTNKLNKNETQLLEADIFFRVCSEVMSYLQMCYQDDFQLTPGDTIKEKEEMDMQFLRCLIKDLIKTKQYTLSGIAAYTQIPEDMIGEYLSGNKFSPALFFLRRLIDIHRTVRPEVYQEVLKKVRNDLKDAA